MAAVYRESISAAVEDEASPSTKRSVNSLARKYRRGKIIKQGYSKEERQDARKEAARDFFLNIPLDKDFKPQNRLATTSLLVKEHHSAEIKVIPDEIKRPPLTTTPPYIPIQHDLTFESPRRSKRKKSSHTKKPSYGGSTIPVHSTLTLRNYITEPEDKRLAFVCSGCPVILTSILPYRKPDKKTKTDTSSSGRTRTNSISVQLELEGGMDLGDPTKEISLAHYGLLDAIWTSTDTRQPSEISATPIKQTNVKRTPGLLTHQSSFHEGLTPPPPDSTVKQYPWQFFREYHSPRYVIINYHPKCLDNAEHFLGRHVTTLNLSSYRVSLLKYARESEVKKEINKQFSDMFPHIKLTLTKLRSIKKEMINVGFECGLDPVAIAHAQVYFEKLVMMGKVNKNTRKTIAGACLLLAVKFSSDMKRSEIKNLIEETTDKFRISQKELMLYEFPTLVALEFSLVTPIHQVKSYTEKIYILENN